MGEKHILQNTIGGGNELGEVTGTMTAPTAGQQQGARGGYRMVSADVGRENVWASSNYTGAL